MGQRLVVTIKKNNEELAKIYYHWSAYSRSALHVAKALVDGAYENESIPVTAGELLLKICNRVITYGGGFGSTSEMEDAVRIIKKDCSNLFTHDCLRIWQEKEKQKNRNLGLIAVSAKVKGEIQGYSEGDLLLDFDDEKVFNSVFSYFDNEKKYLTYLSCTEDEPEKIHVLKNSINDFSFSRLDDVNSFLDSTDDYVFKTAEGKILQLVI